jgi:hypothetical protein
VRREQTVEFAGFLVREDEDALYIADPQGTWVVPRQDAIFVEEWKCPPPHFMANGGRPVRIGVRDRATIHEIRPWQIRKREGSLGTREVRQATERIFTLGGAPLPIGERTMLSEVHMAELERMLTRRLGWNPNCDDPRENPRMDFRSAVSKTIVVMDGY